MEYRWKLPILESEICSGSPQCNRTVKNRSPEHTFCQDPQKIENCLEVPLTTLSKVTYLLGVNGIRNKIALSWRISNMNRVHWNEFLQWMAEKFLLQCSLDLHECTFLGPPSSNINLCQNIVFISSTEDDENPYAYTVRKWCSEYA